MLRTFLLKIHSLGVIVMMSDFHIRVNFQKNGTNNITTGVDKANAVIRAMKSAAKVNKLTASASRAKAGRIRPFIPERLS